MVYIVKEEEKAIGIATESVKLFLFPKKNCTFMPYHTSLMELFRKESYRSSAVN